jgi:hypothetical protein
MKYLREIVEKTTVDLRPRTKLADPEDTQTKKKKKSKTVDFNPKLDHDDEALQTVTKRRHLNERQAGFLLKMLRRKVDDKKRTKKVVKVPPDLTKSGSFPDVNESYEARLEECKRMKVFLSDIKRPINEAKVDRMMRVIRRFVGPIYEGEV